MSRSAPATVTFPDPTRILQNSNPNRRVPISGGGNLEEKEDERGRKLIALNELIFLEVFLQNYIFLTRLYAYRRASWKKGKFLFKKTEISN